MTGPEHYLEAERLIDVANSGDWDDDDSAQYLREARVHAELALAAASALATDITDFDAWRNVAGVQL